MCTGDVVRMVCVDGVLEWFCNGVGQGSGSIIDLMGELGRGGEGGMRWQGGLHAAILIREGGSCRHMHAAMFIREGGLHAAICMQQCL